MEKSFGRYQPPIRAISGVYIQESMSTPAIEKARQLTDEFAEVGEVETVKTYLGREPMSDYKLLLERQAIQLITLYSD